MTCTATGAGSWCATSSSAPPAPSPRTEASSSWPPASSPRSSPSDPDPLANLRPKPAENREEGPQVAHGLREPAPETCGKPRRRAAGCRRSPRTCAPFALFLTGLGRRLGRSGLGRTGFGGSALAVEEAVDVGPELGGVEEAVLGAEGVVERVEESEEPKTEL